MVKSRQVGNNTQQILDPTHDLRRSVPKDLVRVRPLVKASPISVPPNRTSCSETANDARIISYVVLNTKVFTFS